MGYTPVGYLKVVDGDKYPLVPPYKFSLFFYIFKIYISLDKMTWPQKFFPQKNPY